MAVTASPIFPQTIKNTCVTIVAADTTTVKTAYTAGAQGAKIEAWYINSDDTSARDLLVSITISATKYPIATISIPITAGSTNAIACVNVLTHAMFSSLPLDSNGNPYLYLATGTTLTINTLTTVTAAKTITSTVFASDY